MKNSVIVSLVLLFALGTVVGIMGDKLLMCHGIHKGPFPGMHEKYHDRPPMMKPENFILMILKDRLDLNDEQFKKSEAIVKETHSKLKKLKDSFHDQEKKLIGESFDLIKNNLSPEQQLKLEELKKEMKERKGPPNGGPHGHHFPPCDERMGPPPPSCGDPEFEEEEMSNQKNNPAPDAEAEKTPNSPQEKK